MAKVKKSLLGTAFIESLDRVQGNIQNTQQLAVITKRSVIVVRDDRRKNPKKKNRPPLRGLFLYLMMHSHETLIEF